MTVNHLYPTTRPSLDLNFARQKRLDPRVTFTRGSTATYVGDDGLIKTAASNEARFDHDPATGESLGLLVEEAKTNLVLESEDWGNTTYWYSNGNKGGLNNSSSKDYFIATNNTTDVLSPDGANNAVKLTGDTSYTSSGFALGRVNIVPKSITLSQNTVYTFSLFVKDPNSVLDSNQKLWIIFGSAFSNTNGRAAFDLQNNVVTFAADYSNGSGSIESYPNGWKKLTATFANTSSGGTPYIYIQEADNQSGPNTFSTNGESFYAFGFQIEQAYFPTSYIPTSGSTVTRSADVASMTGTNFSSFWNNNAGSVLFDGIPKTTTRLSDYWSAHNTGSRGYELYVNSSGTMYHYINFGASILLNPISAGTRYRVCSAFDTSSINSSVNGGSVISASGVAATGISTFNIGKAYSGYTMNGHIARLTYYPTRLTDSQLQELTR